MMFNKTTASMALVFGLFFFLGVSGAVGKFTQVDLFQKLTPVPPTETDQALEEAFRKSVQQKRNQVLGFQVFEVVIDHIQYAADKSTALIWIALRDPQSGEVIASEPGLAIAYSASPNDLGNPDNWTIVQQVDEGFTNGLEMLPKELLTESVLNQYLTPRQEPGLSAIAALHGYKLPWTAGLAKRVTNSIGHVYSVSGGLASCPSSCRYAYDFADGTMFPMLAAKGGTVKAYKTTCSNGDSNCTNYLVLEDQSTIPTSYQLYYHMATNSMPQRLRTIGAQVLQGEYIGDADDTGASTGHHLHFHVYITPTGANWSWGSSVDFVFDDVSTNAGYPRTCAEASAYPSLGSQCMPGNLYTSGNTPANPPSASFSAPRDTQNISGRVMQVSGTATDDIQVVRIQVLVNYDGTWETLAEIPPTGGSFTKDIDLCGTGVPNGPFGMTLRVYDREGSQARGIPVRQVIWTGSCASADEVPTEPACQPSADQVALYSGTDFRGSCTRFDVNNSKGYQNSQLGAVGDNAAKSIQVGSNVRAVLYDKNIDVTAARVTGRMETIAADDVSLADNLIGAGTISGLWVIARSDLLDAPYINSFGNQVSGANPTSVDSLVFAWEGGSGATGYDVTLNGPGVGWTKTVTGQTNLSVGNLSAGSYTMTVKANAKTISSSRSVTKTFSVLPDSFPAASTRTAPYQESFEGGAGEWVGSGLWRYGSTNMGSRGNTQAWMTNNGTNYADATWRAGDLTSPPIVIPASGKYFLRFSYFADIEDGNPYWDQRRLQISDGGLFKDVYQFSGDKQPVQEWLNSGPIDLSAYAGKTIRLRFHFDTVDEENNWGAGWVIDDVSINTLGTDTSCADSDGPNSSAPLVTLGSRLQGVICPESDIDFFRFNAKAGQNVLVDVDAKSLPTPSKLDSVISLLAADGRSVIVENDDEQSGVQDSLLLYPIQRDGMYFVKLKAWNYPGVGGADYYYQVGFSPFSVQPPQDVKLLYPSSNRLAPGIPFDIEASATDFDGGMVSQMSFFWHGPDWTRPEWVQLGTDTNGSDGWTYPVNPTQYGGVKGSAVYVQAVSRSGGILGAVVWDLLPDQTTPVSQLSALPGQTNSSVVQLKWTATDAQNDIDHFELQYQVNSGSGWSEWRDWSGKSLPGALRFTWFAGAPGASYHLRMRAIDRAGNVEVYPAAYEAATTFASACIPDEAEAQGQTQEDAIAIPRDLISGKYNLCTAGQPGSGDVDWFALDAVQGERLLLLLASRGGGAAFIATLYDPGRQKVQTWQSADYGNSLDIRWEPAATGTYTLEVKPLEESLFGTDTLYQVWYGVGKWYALPFVGN